MGSALIPEEFEKTADACVRAAKAECGSIQVCVGAACLSMRSDALKDAFSAEAVTQGATCKIRGVGCMGPCARGPMVSVQPDGHLYQNVKPADVPELIASVNRAPVERLQISTQHSFFTRQKKIVLAKCGRIDPESIEEYIAEGGYAALVKALTEMQPREVVAEVTTSGLRGRGGAGFPTGLKWATVAKASAAQKYVICNADEGDPGAFMDRSVLAGDPHAVLEGMAIAGYAVGANHGYIYVRAEYPLAVTRLRTAIRQSEKLGLLGRGLLGTPFDFQIELRIGAGAFVCGEETALMASIEGLRGTPRPRPPFPAESGLWGCPTLINNVETFANIAAIIKNGGKWMAAIGTEKSKGTKVFALAGQVANTGLIEVPMGITLREVIFDIGGGIPNGRKFKAVQTGGPSGGCIPEQFLDMSVDYESLAKVGSIMGSGGMVVMDDSTKMPEVAKFFMNFCMTESCGKCIPCRVGTVQMHTLLSKITSGRGSISDVTKLETLCDMVKHTSLCGLGQSAPNPVMSTLRYFRDEYTSLVETNVIAGTQK